MENTAKELVSRIADGYAPDVSELAGIIACEDSTVREHAALLAREATLRHFGRGVYIRGLIEVGSYCRNNCYYCGIRRNNGRAERYRLDDAAILEQCHEGYGLGFRTFVLQGGEDPAFGDERLVPLVAAIRSGFPDCAITLSLGERPRDSYRRLFDAGADRYLLRHETADAEHYARLHPAELRLDERKRCLYALKEIGYQAGSGFMVGSPFQTAGNLAGDLLFLRELEPAMVGLGPFIPHADTPFAEYPAGKAEDALLMISLVRLMLPRALIPATTALATLAEDGRERGILAGANVVMPNLSPVGVRDKYRLYNGKLAANAEAAENLRELADRLAKIGRHIEFVRGDFK